MMATPNQPFKLLTSLDRPRHIGLASKHHVVTAPALHIPRTDQRVYNTSDTHRCVTDASAFVKLHLQLTIMTMTFMYH
jgi:hypothetical protein